MVLAVASGTETPAQMRAAGAATVLFDLNFNKRVGTTANPADPSTLTAKAKSLFDYAVAVTGCQTPVIAENELFGAQTATPWSATNGQYRANVLQFLTALNALGNGGGRSRRSPCSSGRCTSPRPTRRACTPSGPLGRAARSGGASAASSTT
jgi:hypothetical protein